MTHQEMHASHPEIPSAPETEGATVLPLPSRVLPSSGIRKRVQGAHAPMTSRSGRRLGDCPLAAPVSQPVEEVALKAIQSGFEPQRGHRVTQRRPQSPSNAATVLYQCSMTSVEVGSETAKQR